MRKFSSLPPGAILGARRSNRSCAWAVAGGRADAWHLRARQPIRSALKCQLCRRLPDQKVAEVESFGVRHRPGLITGRFAADLVVSRQLLANKRANTEPLDFGLAGLGDRLAGEGVGNGRRQVLDHVGVRPQCDAGSALTQPGRHDMDRLARQQQGRRSWTCRKSWSRIRASGAAAWARCTGRSVSAAAATAYPGTPAHRTPSGTPSPNRASQTRSPAAPPPVVPGEPEEPGQSRRRCSPFDSGHPWWCPRSDDPRPRTPTHECARTVPPGLRPTRRGSAARCHTPPHRIHLVRDTRARQSTANRLLGRCACLDCQRSPHGATRTEGE